jgi:hypothetical protein
MRVRYHQVRADSRDDVQLPGTVSELGSGLADVEVKNLGGGCQQQFSRPHCHNP